jgi:hypothetical protein
VMIISVHFTLISIIQGSKIVKTEQLNVDLSRRFNTRNIFFKYCVTVVKLALLRDMYAGLRTTVR